jgi:hypothetical protein
MPFTAISRFETVFGEQPRIRITLRNSSAVETTLWAAATLRRPDGQVAAGLPLRAVTLPPLGEGSVTWDDPPAFQVAGFWDIRGRVWGDAARTTLLGDTDWLTDRILVGFEVRHHTSTGISSQAADQALELAEAILRDVDGADDVSCEVNLLRVGEVTPFSVGTGIITNSTDFDQAMSVSGTVILVSQINFCGTIVIGALGCAHMPGNRFLVVASGSAGALWGHEFGHNKGLPHNADPSFVMGTIVGGRKVTAGECLAYRTK